MRLVGTKYVKEGAVLAKPIYNDRGRILVNEKVTLDKKLIQRLNDLGVSYVYLEDSLTKDIYPTPTISDKLRMEAMQTMERSFQELQGKSKDVAIMVLEKRTTEFKSLITKVLDELKKQEGLFSMMSDVYLYDQYIFTHSLNVTIYTLALGLELKLSNKELELLGLGAFLHDVGKIDIPLEILLKPDKLTLEEYERIKKHPEVGFEMLRKISSLHILVAHCAFQHHERLNGSGYPRGITEKEIHLFGKILAVADVFDAITSNRVYRQAMLPHEALEVLYTGVGSLYDTKIVEAFRKAIILFPNGLGVTLSNGEKGVVCKQNNGMNDRPVIRVFERMGETIPPYELDLSIHPSILITKSHLESD